jgi:hypothetical protein
MSNQYAQRKFAANVRYHTLPTVTALGEASRTSSIKFAETKSEFV